MNSKNFKRCIYVIIAILVIIFYTKDIDFSGNSHYKKIEIIREPDINIVLVNKNYNYLRTIFQVI